MKKIYKYCMFLMSIQLLVNCIGNDPTKISEDFDWEPSYSFAINHSESGIDDYDGPDTFLEYYETNNQVLISEYVDFSYKNIVDDLDILKSLMYRFYIVNEFPAQIELYAYFYDDNGNQIGVGSIFENTPEIIEAPQFNYDGDLILNTEKTIDVEITEDELATYADVSRVLLRIYFKDLETNENIINQLENYEVDISVGIRAEVSVTNY